MKLDEIIRTGLSRVDTIAVRRTALNPALWIVGLICPLSLVLAAFATDANARLALFCFAAIPLLGAIIAYFILMFRDPDRLQSEEYRVKQQAMLYLYERGGSTEIVDVANQNPRVESSKSLPHLGEKE